MNYGKTIEFLFSQFPAYHRIGKAAYKNDLHNSKELDEYQGHPHLKFRSIHIAGTNGKGSVSHMIASGLMEAGYKTGLYTSPHLLDFRERIRVNGKMISKGSVTGFVRKHSAYLRSLKPSFFEMTVALAFEYFAEQNVDIAVIEVGLGGRLDSTNVINPVLSVITNIGHDHMDLLGSSLDKIAIEKGGIIKRKVPVVIGETQPEIKDIFITLAREADSDIYFADQNFLCELGEMNYKKGGRKYRITDTYDNTNFTGRITLGGDYQAKNIKSVFQSFKVLDGIFEVSHRNILDGIRKVVSNTQLKGRWQIIGRKPLTICDTGHNMEGLMDVMNQINNIPFRKLHMVIGFVNDKDLSLILPLLPVEGAYYFTKASVTRALDEQVLMCEAAGFGLKGRCFNNVGSAVHAAGADASENDLIFIGGSTFIVADALSYLNQRESDLSLKQNIGNDSVI